MDKSSGSSGGAEQDWIGAADRFFAETPEAHHHDNRATVKDREYLLRQCVIALQTLPYLEVLGETVTDDPLEMIGIRLTAHNDVPTGFIQAGIRAEWKNRIARGKPSLHVIRVTQSGFDFRFALIDQGIFLTGVFSVSVATTSSEAVVDGSSLSG